MRGPDADKYLHLKALSPLVSKPDPVRLLPPSPFFRPLFLAGLGSGGLPYRHIKFRSGECHEARKGCVPYRLSCGRRWICPRRDAADSGHASGSRAETGTEEVKCPRARARLWLGSVAQASHAHRAAQGLCRPGLLDFLRPEFRSGYARGSGMALVVAG